MDSFFCIEDAPDEVYSFNRDHPDRKFFRDYVEKIWKTYSKYIETAKDRKFFLKESSIDFQARIWEMYLGYTLIKKGFILGKQASSGPDIKLTTKKEDRAIWIEATTSKKGVGKDAVPELRTDGTVQTVPEDKIILRLTQSISEKFEKYEQYISDNVVGPNDPYIIAINRSQTDFVDGASPLMLNAVFGIGHIVLNMKTGKKTWSPKPEIQKSSGKSVPLGYFLDKKYEGISAIIYETHNVLTLSLLSPGSNFIVVHNPLAKNPIPQEFFGDWRNYSLKL